jgi:pilus assembly protein CpaB
MDIPEARRLERPAWINVRTVAGIVLFALAFLGAQRAIEAQRTTTAAWAATRDLATGKILTAGDLRVSEVMLPEGQLDRYALASTDLIGSVITRPIPAGELVPMGGVSEGGARGAGRSMTVPVEIEHAVGGRLGPGDVVDVYATFSEGSAAARTVLLLSGIEVLDVVTAGGLVQEEAAVGLTLSVSPDDAARLAFAIRTAAIDVVRIDDPSASPGTSSVSLEDLP